MTDRSILGHAGMQLFLCQRSGRPSSWRRRNTWATMLSSCILPCLLPLRFLVYPLVSTLAACKAINQSVDTFFRRLVVDDWEFMADSFRVCTPLLFQLFSGYGPWVPAAEMWHRPRFADSWWSYGQSSEGTVISSSRPLYGADNAHRYCW